MRTIEIPKLLWTRRLDEFSRRHEGWLVSLDIASASSAAQHEFRQLPLLGVTAERMDGRTISIAVAEPSGTHLTHIIHSPRKLLLTKTASGATASLEIQAADGSTSLLQVRSDAALRRDAEAS